MDAPELLHALRQLHAERSAAVRGEWNRSMLLYPVARLAQRRLRFQ